MRQTERYRPAALVTGAAQGLGRAYAEELRRRGMSLIVVDRQAELLTEVAQRLDARAVVLDLAAADAAEQLLEAVPEPLGLVVHSAAISPIGPFADIDWEAHRRTTATNVGGTLAVCLFATKRLAPPAGLVLVSSGSAISGAPLVANYAATKAYVEVLACSLSAELEGIDVLAVVPGMINTPMTAAVPPRLDRAPWVRMLEPEVVARESLDDLGREVVSVPGGFGERAGFFAMGRVLPRRLALAVLSRTMHRLYPL
ncbi:MAG: SDR family oxidoreductase [Polyangiaceae bacterium]